MVLGGWIHWPGGAGFKSDDHAIIRYVSDFGNVLADFVGPQYDLEFFHFCRPFITLSFWIDFQLFGVEPFGYFAMNCLALLLAATFLFTLCRSLWPSNAGTVFAVAVVLLWLCHPATGTSPRCWAAGRVDTHYVPPLLLALILHVRYRRGGPRWPVWLVAVVAIGTKESALGFPLLALAIDFLDPRASGRPAPRLFGNAVPAVWYLLLFPACFACRYLFLGDPIGGYHSAPEFLISLGIAPGGLWHMIGRIFFPESPLTMRRFGGAIVVALTLVWLLSGKGKRERILAGGLIAAGVFGPIVQLFEHAQSSDVRLSYFPSVLVLMLWAGVTLRIPRLDLRWRMAIVAVPLLWIFPSQITERERMDEHDAFNESLKTALKECDALLPEGEVVVVAGDAYHAKHPYRFGWAFGSVLKPPFQSRPREVVTLCNIRNDLPVAPVSMVALGLPAWVEVSATGGRVVTASPEFRAANRKPTTTVGFSGEITLDLIMDQARRQAAGFRVPPDFTGRFAICSTLGSTTTIAADPTKGLVSVLEVLAPVANEFWVAMDLDKDSPFLLLFETSSGIVVGKLTAPPGFARRYVQLRWGK